MILIEIPAIRATDVVAVTLECVELAGRAVCVVTTRETLAHPPMRRWFADEAPALAHAAEQADRHGLMLLDLREPGDPE